MERMERPRNPFLKPALLFLIISLILPAHELNVVDLAPSYNSSDNGMMQHNKTVKVGVVIDMGSWIGKSIHSCMEMAIADFYASKHHFKTRVVLHTRDTRGDSRHAISSAVDLLENVKVQALIMGPETVLEAKYLGTLGNKAKVPIFSFSSTLTSPGDEYPFLVQINQDETLQFKAIASIVNWHQWRTVSVIYEDTDDGHYCIPYLVGSLQERSIRVSHRAAISPFSTDDQILDKLHKFSTLQQTIFIVHLSASNTYRLFSIAKRLGMMKEGYAWIVTDKTMNQLQPVSGKVIRSMQGVVGLKAYIPSSSELQDLSLKWKKEFYSKNPSVESGELNVLSIWAYDTIWALAEKSEGDAYGGKKLLDDIARTKFSGLSGEFQIMDGRLNSESFEVVNVIGKGERSVGFWTSRHGMINGRSLSSSSTSQRFGLDEAIVWPGITTSAPRGLLMTSNGTKLRIGFPINEGFEQFTILKVNNVYNVGGFCIDVFVAVLDSLPYQVAFEFIPWMESNGNNRGSYSELLYQLHLEEFDGVLGDITITGNRSLYVDFTVTYTDIGIGTIIKREKNDIWLFSKPLQPDLWVAIIAFLVLTGLVVWLIEHPANQEFQGSVVHQIGTILWFGFSTLFYAHRERLTSNLSRLVVIVWLFAVLVITATYTATLSSMLTLQKIQLGSEGVYIGTHNSIVGQTIANNLNFKDNRLKRYSSPEEFADALSRGSKKGGVDAIIDEIPYLKVILAKYGDEYAMIASQSTTNGFGFAFNKKYAQLVSDMSHAIIKLREEGKLAEMENMWIKGGSSSFMPDAKNAATQPNILNLRSFGGLFIITFVSCVFALLVHLISILQNKLDYWRYIIRVFPDGGILAYMLSIIAPSSVMPTQTR